jgi:hypothetical protein
MVRTPPLAHEPASRATVWSWLGFLLGLALYLTVSAAFDWMPQDDMPRGLWFTLGLVPAFVGFSIGLVRAAGRDADDAQRDSASPSST